MKLTPITALLFLLMLTFCSPAKKDQQEDSPVSPQVTTEDMKRLGILEHTDPFTVQEQGDSVVFQYPYTRVVRTPKGEEVGEMITVYNGDDSFTVKEEACYFQGLLGKFMIVDSGTGSVRTLNVYDVQLGELVFSTTYYEALIVKGQNIGFEAKVETEEVSNKPECPEELKDAGSGLGYLEEQYLDLSTMGIVRTGQFKCAYFE